MRVGSPQVLQCRYKAARAAKTDLFVENIDFSHLLAFSKKNDKRYFSSENAKCFWWWWITNKT